MDPTPPHRGRLQRNSLRNGAGNFWVVSQPVRSQRRCFRVCENRRHFQGLGLVTRLKGIEGKRLTYRRPDEIAHA